MPSNLVATLTQDYISDYIPSLDKFEQRASEYGALNLFKAQSAGAGSILDPQVKANIERSFSNTIKIPVINYKDVSIGSARTCALQTDGLVSALVTVTAVTYAFGFAMFPMQHYENFISYQTAFNRAMTAGLQKLASTMDSASVAVLEANKNQYWPQAILDYYAVTGDALQVPQAEKNDFYNRAASIMGTMDMPSSGIDVVTNHIGMADVRRVAAQGQANSSNLQFQLLGYTWWPTARILNGSGTIESTGYMVSPGSVALASRNSPDAKARTRIHENKYWDIFPNAPLVGLDLDVYYQADCTDASAVQASGMSKYTQTSVQSFQFSVDVFYLKFYNSAPTTTYSPIVKFEILA